MPSDIKNQVIFDEILSINGIGDIHLKWDSKTSEKRKLYFESLKNGRGIMPPELVDIADPITLFYIVFSTYQYFEPSAIAEIRNNRLQVSKDVAELSVARARRYHIEAASAASNEALAVAIVDELFKVQVDPVTRRSTLVPAEGITLPEVPESYWDDSEINVIRQAEGLPPYFPKNRNVLTEQKLAVWSTILAQHREVADAMNDLLRTNIVSEIQSEMLDAFDKGGSADVDMETGFQSGGTDAVLHDVDDAAGESV